MDNPATKMLYLKEEDVYFLLDEAKKEGIKEVVGWIEGMNISLDINDHIAIEGDAWVIKKREWDIEP